MTVTSAKVHCHDSKKVTNAVTVTFSMPHKQKVNRGGKTKFVNIARGHSKKNLHGVKQNTPTLQGGKGPFTLYFIVVSPLKYYFSFL
jgi:hypothetical protein